VAAKQKMLILLLKDIFQLSNRKMANLITFFSALTGVDTSYKTIERAYSDTIVKMIIHNMFVIMMKRKGIRMVDLTGDGTGYSLTITKHYRTVREKEGEAVKSNVGTGMHVENAPSPEAKTVRKKIFTYAFAFMDLGTHMYVGYGASMKSEKDAFNKAVTMMQDAGLISRSVRLDKYYGSQSTVYVFDRDTTIYIIPRDDITISGPYAWKGIIRNLMTDPFSFLKKYYKRENSESGFSADKRCDGWKVWQRLDDRIDTAVMCKGVWHNLLWLSSDT
jgi:transposase